MDSAQVEAVRRFNRTVTQRVGALDDHYLSRDHSLGEARVLWEIGEAGCDVRELRERLDLDSGYLSRLLRALETAKLVTVRATKADARVRRVQLTAKGKVERALLDERSDELAASMLEPLSSHQRDRLVTAMADVERLLTATLVETAITDPETPVAQECLRRYFQELDERIATGFDPDAALPADPHEMRAPSGLFLVATLRGEAIGCGGLKFHPKKATEVKRMWVAPDARGLGLGRRLLTELEAAATEHGSRTLRLDTNGALTQAIAMYRSSGYREIPAFNDEPHATLWFEKRLSLRS